MTFIPKLSFASPVGHLMASALSVMALSACAPDGDSVTTETTPPRAAATLNNAAPLLIAHRGASGEMPEHTIAAYELAIAQGADCIEPDLVVTKDGVLVDRHDIYLSTTTDVADRPEFADRKRPAPDEAHAGGEDWWVADFTLAELKTLKARQPFKGRSKEFDGQFDVPPFDEVLDLALVSQSTSGAQMCIYPEAKAPAYHASLGFEMVDMIDRALVNKWMAGQGDRVFVQSFEPPFVKRMHAIGQYQTVMLAGDQAAYDAAMAVEGAPFWTGAGVTHGMLFNDDGTSSGFVERAHDAGIAVHTWTYRDDALFGDEPIETSIRKALALGLDGFFTDFPATGRRVLDAVAAESARSAD